MNATRWILFGLVAFAHVGGAIDRLDTEFLLDPAALFFDGPRIAEAVDADIGALAGKGARDGEPDA